MRYLSFLILLVTLAGCQRHLVQKIDPYDISQVILHYGVELKYDKHIHLEDSVVFYDQWIEKIRLDFSTQVISCDLWASRELLVDTVEGLLNRINGNSDISPYLGHFPFTADDLEVNITYTSFYGEYVNLQNGALATLRNGNAYYYTFTAFDCSQDCFGERKEYYWQSKMFVDYKREGETLYAPKPNPLESVFGVERYIPPSK